MFTITKGPHQTAILIPAGAKSERVKRLLDSVNRPNTIKANVHEVPEGHSFEAAASLARAAGYVLVISAMPAELFPAPVFPDNMDSDPDDPDTWADDPDFDDE